MLSAHPNSEAALAPDNTCLMGGRSFSLSNVVRASRWLDHKRRFAKAGLISHAGRLMTSYLWYWVDKKHGRAVDEHALTHLVELLRHGRELNCSDDCDHVYAVLSLHLGDTRDIHPLLRPDYTKSASDVIRDAVFYQFQECLFALTDLSHQTDDALETSGNAIMGAAISSAMGRPDELTACHHDYMSESERSPTMGGEIDCSCELRLSGILEVEGLRAETVR